MKARLLVATFLLFGGLGLKGAEPKAELGAAINALGAQGYSWVTTTSDSSQIDSYLEGKTDPTGLVELHSQSGKMSWITLLRGEKSAIQVQGRWYDLDTALQLANGSVEEVSDGKNPIYLRTVGRGGETVGNTQLKMTGVRVVRMEGVALTGFVVARLQDFQPPVIDVGDYLADAVKLEAKDQVFTLTLSENTARKIGRIPASRVGNRTFDVKDISGVAKVWVAKGIVRKYEVTVRWRLDGTRRSRVLETKINETGTPPVTIPADATSLLR